MGIRFYNLNGFFVKKLAHGVNIAFLVAAVLYGQGDFIRTITMCINFGKDTDCTAAGCGALLGLAYGCGIHCPTGSRSAIF